MKLSRNRYFSQFDNIHEWIIFILKNEKKANFKKLKKKQTLRSWKLWKSVKIENFEMDWEIYLK